MLDSIFACFVSGSLLGITVFENGPVLTNRAAAGGREAGCSGAILGNYAPSIYVCQKGFFSPLTGSDCYFNCLTTLWKGCPEIYLFVKEEDPFYRHILTLISSHIDVWE